MKRVLKVLGWLLGGVLVLLLLGLVYVVAAGYAGMHVEDLAAIYEYLRTVEPVRHRVGTFESAAGARAAPGPD